MNLLKCALMILGIIIRSRDLTYQEAKINKNIENCYKPVPR